MANTRHAAAAAKYLADLAADPHPTQGPSPTPCVCGADRGAHGGKTFTGASKATGCSRYRVNVAVEFAILALWADARRSIGRDLNDYFQGRRVKGMPKRAEGEWGVGPSDTSSCRRWIQYRERPPEDYVPLPDNKRAAAMGSAIHEASQIARKALYPWRVFEGVVTVDGLDRPGRFDDYDEITATLADTKTRGDYRWDVDGKIGPFDSEWGQLSIYALALIRSGKPVRILRIETVNRATGSDEVYTRPYDEAFALEWLNRLMAINTALDLGQDLPRDRSGPTTDPLCGLCPARRHCWNMDAAEAAGRSPESYTVVRDDEDVAWALETYDQARTQATEGKKAQEHARTLLDGVEGGSYGEIDLSWGGGDWKEPEPDLAARVEQLERFYDEPVRPPLHDLAFPVKTVRATTRISVKRHRVAKLARNAKTPTPPHEPTEETA